MIFASTVEEVGNVFAECIHDEYAENGITGVVKLINSGEFDFDFCLQMDGDNDGWPWFKVRALTAEHLHLGDDTAMMCCQCYDPDKTVVRISGLIDRDIINSARLANVMASMIRKSCEEWDYSWVFTPRYFENDTIYIECK